MEFCYDVKECNNISVHMFLTQFKGLKFEVEKGGRDTVLHISLLDSDNATYVNNTDGIDLTIDNDAFKKDITETIYVIVDSLRKGNWTTQKAVNTIINDTINFLFRDIEDLLYDYLDPNKCPYCGVQQRELPPDQTQVQQVRVIDNHIVVGNYNTTRVNIKYCPMCGRKLVD